MKTFIVLNLIVFSSLTLSNGDFNSEMTKMKSIFDIIFANWRTVSIASVGIAFDLFFKRIPYPNEKNTTLLFKYMDEDNDQKVDVNEFETYLIKLFHAHDVLSYESGRSVSAAQVAKIYTINNTTDKTHNYRWNCFIDQFDANRDKLLDFSEFRFIRIKRSQALSCIVCIKYVNHCINFHDLYLIKP